MVWPFPNKSYPSALLSFFGVPLSVPHQVLDCQYLRKPVLGLYQPTGVTPYCPDCPQNFYRASSKPSELLLRPRCPFSTCSLHCRKKDNLYPVPPLASWLLASWCFSCPALPGFWWEVGVQLCAHPLDPSLSSILWSFLLLISTMMLPKNVICLKQLPQGKKKTNCRGQERWRETKVIWSFPRVSDSPY